MNLVKRCIGEFFGTFWLVIGGCGSAVLAAAYTDAVAQSATSARSVVSVQSGIGTVGVAIAFGLTLVTMAYLLGQISGCHLNPAVSFGLWAGKRFPASELLPYILAQIGGAIVAGLCIYAIASGKPGYGLTGTNPLATNGFGAHSPQAYSLFACFLTEVLMTFAFLMVILGATDRRTPPGFAPLAIGSMLTLIHLISIPVTNTSVNPARSTGPAILVGLFGNNTELVGQLWLFWIAPILGAIGAGLSYNKIFESTTVDRSTSTELQGH